MNPSPQVKMYARFQSREVDPLRSKTCIANTDMDVTRSAASSNCALMNNGREKVESFHFLSKNTPTSPISAARPTIIK